MLLIIIFNIKNLKIGITKNIEIKNKKMKG